MNQVPRVARCKISVRGEIGTTYARVGHGPEMVLHFRLNSTKMMKLIGEARSVYRTQTSLPKKPRGQQGDG
ncbi:hypothetical protein ACLKA7_016334 [Drosophila subpalustris]